jgi:hypothetical protein
MTAIGSVVGKHGGRWLAAAAATVPLLFVLHSRVVCPRPYTISEIDIEQDYFYNALLLKRGLPVGSSHHPGTPVYYLSSVLLRLSGVEFENTQRFFNLAYWIVAFVSAGAIAFFCLTVLRNVSLWAAVMALGLLFAWPPVLSYWTYYGADSWSLSLGLLMVTLFWREISCQEGRVIWGVLCGAAAGVGLAVKMTFVPLVLSLLLAEVVRMVMWYRRTLRESETGRRKPLRAIVAHCTGLTAALGAAYLLATAPILGRLPALWYNTFRRPDVRPPAGAFGASLVSSLTALWRWNPLLVLAGSSAIAAFVYCGASLVAKPLRRQREERSALRPEGSGYFDYPAAGVFLVGLLLALSYTLASSVVVTPGAELGIRLRNTAPSALVLPMMIVFVDRARHDLSVAWFGRRSAGLVAFVFTTAFILAWAAIGAHRQSFVARRSARSMDVRTQTALLSQASRRTAFWTGAADDQFAEASFHFWGNYRYGHDRFDQDLLERFSEYSLLRLRDFSRMQDENLAGTPQGRQRSRYGRLGDLVWGFIHGAPTVFRTGVDSYKRDYSLVTGEGVGVKPSAFVFPESQLFELRGSSLPAYVKALAGRFGPLRLEKRAMGGENWIVLLRASAAEDPTQRW